MLEIAQSWLNTQCSLLPGVEHGVVVRLGKDDDEPAPVAVWPERVDGPLDTLLATAKQAAHRASVTVADAQFSPDVEAEVMQVPAGIDEDGTPLSLLGCPLYDTHGQFGAVALSVRGHLGSQQQAVLKLLRWGAAWFDLMGRNTSAPATKDRLISVVEVLATSFDHESTHAAATAAVNELAVRLKCARVTVGLVNGRNVQVQAMSHSAEVEERSNLVRDIIAAMHEALDQDASVICPPPPGAPPLIAFAQEQLYQRNNHAPVCSTPLYSAGKAVGALTLEWERGEDFDPGAVELAESFAALFGPVLELKRERDRSIFSKVGRSIKAAVWRLIGPRHAMTKLTALAMAAVAIVLATTTGEYRVAADASIEGRVQRVVVAPQDGFVASAEVRAGDEVEAGQLLATLDDRDLQLERVKLQSEYDQLVKEQRAALGARDRSGAAILRAQMRQAQAQLSLVDARLERTRLVAPFAGVVVAGDLSQLLGSPVAQGDTLFEVAPLDAYRVVLEVDERDIGNVVEQGVGKLALTGLPETELGLTVNRVLPVSAPREGRNYFKVEAHLDTESSLLRPGMQGVAKLSVDERKLAWIWGHTLVDWLRLQLWRWTG